MFCLFVDYLNTPLDKTYPATPMLCKMFFEQTFSQLLTTNMLITNEMKIIWHVVSDHRLYLKMEDAAPLSPTVQK